MYPDRKTAEALLTEDVRRRYGDYPQNKWDINLAIKAHFEALAGRDIYDIVGQPTARR